MQFICTREEKPPIGVKPKKLHNQARAIELTRAVQRCLDAGHPVQSEWVEELATLCADLSKGVAEHEAAN